MKNFSPAVFCVNIEIEWVSVCAYFEITVLLPLLLLRGNELPGALITADSINENKPNLKLVFFFHQTKQIILCMPVRAMPLRQLTVFQKQKQRAEEHKKTERVIVFSSKIKPQLEFVRIHPSCATVLPMM